MAVFVQDGRVVLAKLLFELPFFLGVGEGLPEWDSVPPPTTPEDQAMRDAELAVLTDLENSVGLTRLRDRFYVVPDPEGDIVLADGARYSRSTEPTHEIFVRFQLDLADARDSTLRETGIFVDAALKPEVPAGQMYIPNADIVSFGSLIEVDHFAPIVRDGSIGQTFSYLLTM